jgi:hypothetical protein
VALTRFLGKKEDNPSGAKTKAPELTSPRL